MSKNKATVFISYAHESEALGASVKALADWLGNRGCSVLTDHRFQYRPPEVGWQAWMQHCIDEADIVLVVGSPKLKLRYEKNAPVDTGRGATFEGAIVTQRIYDNAMRNTKFFPILPDGDGREADIPTTLMAWWNNHRFPSGNEGILRMIVDEPSACGSQEEFPDDESKENGSTWTINEAHQEKTEELLSGAPAFFATLQREFRRYFNSRCPETEAAMVQFFARSETGKVQNLFYLVRRALSEMEKDTRDTHARQPSEESAAYLYCLAACRLVDQAERQARLSQTGNRYIVHVPTDENVVCAIIATALFGGELRLVPSEIADLPRAEYLFEVKAPESSDQIASDFEVAAYIAVFGNASEVPEESLERGSGRTLTPQQQRRLDARIRDFKNVAFASLAFLVPALEASEAKRFAAATGRFAQAYQVPVLLHESDSTSQLLGMPVDALREEIREFWGKLKGRSRSDKPSTLRPQPPSPSTSGTPVTSPSGPVINIGTLSGGLAFAGGSYSAAQAGAGHTAHIEHRQGTDYRSELIPLLQNLAQEIDKLPSAKARDKLTEQFQIARIEAAEKERTDAGVIKQALDAIKSGAEVLEDGGKIIALCNRAYNVVAPWLGLPPSPLP